MRSTIRTKVANVAEQQRTEKLLLTRLSELTGEHYLKESNVRTVTVDRNCESGVGMQIERSPARREPSVSYLDQDGPAAAAGIMVGDILISVDGCNCLGVDIDAIESILSPYRDVDTSETQDIAIVVCSPIFEAVGEADVMSDGDDESIAPAGRMTKLGKAPSYVTVKETLIREFGEEAFQHSKKKVQQRLEIVSRQTAGENAAHLGEEETMLTAANVLAEHMEKQATRVGEKMKDAGSWVSNKIEQLKESEKLGMLRAKEREAQKVAQAKKDAKEDSALRARVLAICADETPPLVCQSVFGESNGISLSFTGMQTYIVAEFSERAYDRNKAWIQIQIQTRELEMQSGDGNDDDDDDDDDDDEKDHAANEQLVSF